LKRELTFQLLHSILPDPPWREDRLRETLADLRVLAEHKYNKYEMYQPARLFFESLYLFLLRFREEDRTAVLEFVRHDLTFISRDEFQQLAHILYHDRIRQEQLNLAAQRSGIPRFRVSQLVDSREFRTIKRASLYVGLSDGARMDYFRRQNLDVDNEQVLAAYYAGDVKVGGVKRDLRKALGNAVAKFECLFLLDDFFGSGRTLLREVVNVSVVRPADGIEIPAALTGKLSFDEDKNELQWNYAGAVDGEMLQRLQEFGNLYQLTTAVEQIARCCANRETLIKGSLDRISAEKILTIVREDASVYLAPLLATQYAIDRLVPLIPRLKPPLNTLRIIPAAVVPNNMRTLSGSGTIAELCREYYDAEIADEHTGDVVFGYDSCGLPLILHHNTPNNSLYFLWARKWGDALFARYERHGRDPRA
jgi:hypothetical protein